MDSAEDKMGKTDGKLEKECFLKCRTEYLGIKSVSLAVEDPVLFLRHWCRNTNLNIKIFHVNP